MMNATNDKWQPNSLILIRCDSYSLPNIFISPARHRRLTSFDPSHPDKFSATGQPNALESFMTFSLSRALIPIELKTGFTLFGAMFQLRLV